MENWVFEIFSSKSLTSLRDPPVNDTCFAQRCFKEMFANTLFLACILAYFCLKQFPKALFRVRWHRRQSCSWESDGWSMGDDAAL